MSDLTVERNAGAHRFEVNVEGRVAFLTYEERDDEIVILHTEVPTELGGRGLGGLLAKEATRWARAESGKRLVVLCPFVRDYMRRHPE
jgi:predicted GNAT family acetyltransferase